MTERSHNLNKELPAYQAKINLLKQINDAASTVGDASSRKGGAYQSNKLRELNSLRGAEAKRSA
jgi:hypothetical protein